MLAASMRVVECGNRISHAILLNTHFTSGAVVVSEETAASREFLYFGQSFDLAIFLVGLLATFRYLFRQFDIPLVESVWPGTRGTRHHHSIGVSVRLLAHGLDTILQRLWGAGITTLSSLVVEHHKRASADVNESGL